MWCDLFSQSENVGARPRLGLVLSFQLFNIFVIAKEEYAWHGNNLVVAAVSTHWTLCHKVSGTTVCRNGARRDSARDEKSLLCTVWATTTFLGLLPHNNESSWRQGSLCGFFRALVPLLFVLIIIWNTVQLFLVHSPVWARGRCRISPPRFLAECCKRQLNQVSLVLLYFRLSAFSDLYWVCLSVFSCTV